MDGLDYLAIGILIGIVLAVVPMLLWRRWRRRGVLGELQRFFNVDPNRLSIVSRRFPRYDLPNLQSAIDTYGSEVGAHVRVIGYSSFHGEMGTDLRSLLGSNIPFMNVAVAPPVRREVDIDVGHQQLCVEHGIHLVDGADGRVAAHVYSSLFGQGDLMLEVLAPTAELAGAFLERIRFQMTKANVFRGKVISLECGSDKHLADSCANIRFHRLPKIETANLILPAETMDLLTRNSVGFFDHRLALRQSGRSLKRGILLHGKPGTGKTYTAKWLGGCMHGVTVILMSGEDLWLIKQCCQMARMLAPSLVIMEDVDLIASSRSTRQHPASQITLHQLLNEMDGLGSDAEVLFLLTTNRPEAIETALAGRPGRIDQAIEFPLPDPDCRRLLIELFGKGLDVRLADVEQIVARLDGASPAFIQELMRKAALLAVENGASTDGRIKVNDQDLLAGLRELVLGGGDLTRRLFGFGSDAKLD